MPHNVFTNNHFALGKDLGLHLKRLGFDKFESLIFNKVPITDVGQLEPNAFSLSAGFKEDGSHYVVTFDFGYDVLNQLVGKIPNNAIEKLLIRNKDNRTVVRFADRAFLVDIDCKVGDTLQENKDEIFLPLIINKII